jgi:hypothetical protein
MFSGITAEGINREAATTLECTSLCRDNKCKSLAIPETAMLRLASQLPTATETNPQSRQEPMFRNAVTAETDFRPNWIDIARGILPSLRHIVTRERAAESCRTSKRQLSNGKIAPDSVHDSSRASIDPFGNDYFCKLCDHELSNTYFHCEGCETLLSQDFNICSLCFSERKFLVNKVMHDCCKSELHPNKHHVGQPSSYCDCDSSGMVCDTCENCMTCCCCVCHTTFSKRFRFFSAQDLNDILQRTEELVGGNEIEYARETELRLDRVAMVEANSNGPGWNAQGCSTDETRTIESAPHLASAVFDLAVSHPTAVELDDGYNGTRRYSFRSAPVADYSDF